MTTRRHTLLARILFAYVVAGFAALCVAAVLAPVALILYVVTVLR